MQKKEIILLAALFNAVILSFLFVTAIQESTPLAAKTLLPAPGSQSLLSKNSQQTPSSSSLNPKIESPKVDAEVITLDPWPQDEVDHALQSYLTKDSSSSFSTASAQTLTESSDLKTIPGRGDEEYRQTVVKRGDALDKIARQYGVSVKEIKKLNQLTSDRLSIGQVLILPPTPSSSEVIAARNNTIEKAPVQSLEVQSYTMKAGDNPWKIARTHKMKLEDLLKLNGWTEESARNLQTGDVIKVYSTN